ncbi:recombinase family protein [Brevibacillus borstelensis]|uniref:recombinase family protein n=1 Tax=Brevibacillus borstelensis TaxID=45462 RepID=UPI0030F97051
MSHSKIALYYRTNQKVKVNLLEKILNELQMVAEKYFGENIVTQIYLDNDVSGLSDDHKEFQRMLQDIKDKKVTAVITTEISRISRSISTLLDFMHRIKEMNIQFISLKHEEYSSENDSSIYKNVGQKIMIKRAKMSRLADRIVKQKLGNGGE